MFHYPYYEDDEGTYMSQAWAVTNLGQLAPYTYIYDHAPAGWLLIALWTKLTGGFFTFGFSVNSGRALMLILHLASSVILYLITRKLTQNQLVAFLSVLLFSLSPLGIYYQRRVLLDNIMVFWLLLSFYLFLISNRKISLIFLSGLILGIAAVTKETALVFLPGFLYLVSSSAQNHRTSILFSFFILFLVPVGIYIFYAATRGELFPGSGLSLIGTFQHQLSRFGGKPDSFRLWFQMDPIIITLGLMATIVNLTAFTSRPNRIVALLSVLYLFFLLKSQLVLEFYILPFLPFLALNISLATWYFLINQNTRSTFLIVSLLLAIMVFDLLFFGYRSKTSYHLFTTDQTSAQISAVNWILTQSNPDSVYVIDNYAYVDLHQNPDNHFAKAEYYWKFDTNNNLNVNKINFLLLTSQMKTDISNPGNGLGVTSSAYQKSVLIKHFLSDGWNVDILKIP